MKGNLKYILNEMSLLKKEEAKINYYFEPIYKKENKYWKRHLNFSELKQDFTKDIINYGFSPYLPKTYQEQKENKNIMRYSKSQNYGYSSYIKKIYEDNSKKDIYKENLIKFYNRILDSNKRKEEKFKRILKIKCDKNNTFLSRIYNKLNNSEKYRKKKEILKRINSNTKILSPKTKLSRNLNKISIKDNNDKGKKKDNSSFNLEFNNQINK